MAVARKMTRVVLYPGSPGKVRYSIQLTGEDCQKGTAEAKARGFLFLHWIADNQPLLACGPQQWEKMRIEHNGTCWQLDAEAEVDEDVPDDGD
jgi:hypothetical protein